MAAERPAPAAASAATRRNEMNILFFVNIYMCHACHVWLIRARTAVTADFVLSYEAGDLRLMAYRGY
jgi:hypothetical protein